MINRLKNLVNSFSAKIKRFMPFDFKNTDISQGSPMRTKIVLWCVSLFISVMIWSFVAWDGNMEGTKTFSVPVQYTGVPTGSFAFTTTKKVDIRLSGRLNFLSKIDHGDIKALVDLGGLRVGRYSLPIKIETPQFTIIKTLSPSTAKVEIYRKKSKTVPTAWRLEGAVPEGKAISSVEINPPSVLISGPEQDIETVESVMAVIQTERLKDSNEITVTLDKIGLTAEEHDRITMQPEQVNAKVFLEDEIVSDKIPLKISLNGQPEDGLEVDTIRVVPDRVPIRGKSELVRGIHSLSLSPVDITGLDSDIELMVPLESAKAPSGVDIEGPEFVRVEIKLKSKVLTKFYPNFGIIITGSSESKEWKIVPQTVDVTVEGPQGAVNVLQGSHVPFELYVDVSNIVTKQVSLPVLVRGLRSDVKILKIEPEQVTVTSVE